MDPEQDIQLMKLLEDEFMCPIYKMPIRNPVITPVGITYEKEALEGWLDINGVEPQSKNPLDKNSLIQNLALKGLISKIYKEVPKLQKSLIEKDDTIANLTEEIAQLRKELEFEQQKNQENEDLMDYTLEKTKKIRKIQDDRLREKEKERLKSKQKVKEISKLKQALREQKMRQKIVAGQMQSLKDEISRLNNQFAHLRKEVQSKTERVNQLTKHRRESIIALKEFQREAFSNSKSEFWHRQHMIEAVFNKIRNLYEFCVTEKANLSQFKDFVDVLVDDVLHQRERKLVASASQANSTRDLFQKLHNRIRIQRYLLDLQLKLESDDPLEYHHKLIKVERTVGYEIDFMPFSQPPTEQELQIDWSNVVRMECFQITQEKWEIFMSQISKFPNLKQLQITQFSVTNLKCTQLSSIPKLKKLVIQNWVSIDQNQRQEIETFKLNHPEVKMVVLQNNELEYSEPDFDNLEPGWQNALP